MADNIIEIVKELGIFTIAAQTLLHFCPNKNYAKYIKIVISCMTLVILIVPVLGLFERNAGEEFKERIHAYGETIESIQKRQKELAEYQRIDFLEETKKEIKGKLSAILSESGYEIWDLEIAGEEEEQLFITLKPKGNSIQIARISVESEKSTKLPTKEEIMLKNEIAAKLGIGEGYLEVRIYE